MTALDTPQPENLINRELSWLEFNQRVLDEAQNCENPALERLKFLAITGGNLDEFFMVRIGSLHILIGSEHSRPDATGLTPDKQLAIVAERVREMMAQQYDCLDELLAELQDHDIRMADVNELNRKQTDYLRKWFDNYVNGVVSPILTTREGEFPLLVGSNLALCVRLKNDPGLRMGGAPLPDEEPEPDQRFAILPIGEALERFVTVPSDSGYSFALVEDVICRFLSTFFPGQEILETVAFRITRNADMRVDEDGAFDLLQGMQQILSERKESNCVRLELDVNASAETQMFLLKQLNATPDQVFFAEGPLRLADWFSIASVQGYDGLRNDSWPPQDAPEFPADQSIFEVIRGGDRLLYHPYQTFDPVVRMVEQAAGDPDVLAIKQTLYRTSRKSPIVQALEKAALNKKSVTVVVELKARFDEARNIEWAKRLERAGVNVIYGVRGLKTHAKVCVVVRKDSDRLRRYIHFGTGNYNESTASLYSDVSYFTCDDALGNDVIAFFNAISGMSVPQTLQKLAMAPLGLRQKLLEMIEVETENARNGLPTGIRAKVNSLVDPVMIQALYRASQAGVPIELNVRSICCLRPGVEGLSETIRVVSIVDRFLEHARIFHFHHGGDSRVFISSADWMGRNLDRRVELLVPIDDPSCRSRLLEILEQYFQDNTKAKVLMSDGSYSPVPAEDAPPHRSQYELYKDAVQRMAEHSRAERSMFQPYRGGQR